MALSLVVLATSVVKGPGEHENSGRRLTVLSPGASTLGRMSDKVRLRIAAAVTAAFIACRVERCLVDPGDADDLLA
jgi:hypothetical protein